MRKIALLACCVLIAACSKKPGDDMVGSWTPVNVAATTDNTLKITRDDNNVFLVDQGNTHIVTTFRDDGLYDGPNQIAGFDPRTNYVLFQRQTFKKD